MERNKALMLQQRREMYAQSKLISETTKEMLSDAKSSFSSSTRSTPSSSSSSSSAKSSYAMCKFPLLSFFFSLSRSLPIFLFLIFLHIIPIVSSTEDDFLNNLTSKISLKLRDEVIEQELNHKLNDNHIKTKLLKSMDEYLETELSSFNCQVCYEVMRPPDHLPILLFPCGHTFCEKCLKEHLKVRTKPEQQTCPYCR